MTCESVEQQATLRFTRTRALLTRQRTMMANALRAALSEIGIVAAQGLQGIARVDGDARTAERGDSGGHASGVVGAGQHWQALDADERVLEQQIAKARPSAIRTPAADGGAGVGPIIASTVLAKVPDANLFRPGATSRLIGLTGRDLGTGGKHRPGRISELGDRVLRAPLITGAREYVVAN